MKISLRVPQATDALASYLRSVVHGLVASYHIEHTAEDTHNFQTTQTTVGAAGSASALPATPTGYFEVQVNGTTYVVPYYAQS